MAMKTTITDPATLNVWQKLLKARQMFLDADVKKTGINRHLEFKYFELDDIVPVATAIGNEVGLLFITTFELEYAQMTVVNVNAPDETILFRSPMKEIDSIETKSGGKITNAVQNLGSVETYQRRYLYMTALDITEHDEFDPAVGEQETPKTTASAPAPTKASKKPVTPEKREEIKNEVVNSSGQAEPLQIEALQNVMQQLLDLDPEKESLIQEIVLQTNKLTNISKTACEELIEQLGSLVASYAEVNAAPDDESVSDDTIPF